MHDPAHKLLKPLCFQTTDKNNITILINCWFLIVKNPDFFTQMSLAPSYFFDLYQLCFPEGFQMFPSTADYGKVAAGLSELDWAAYWMNVVKYWA